MFTKSPKPTEELDKAIKALLVRLSEDETDPKIFTAIVDELPKLYKLKEQHAPKRISPDTILLVAGNLLGIIIIVGYEHAHVITSKALSFVLKLK